MADTFVPKSSWSEFEYHNYLLGKRDNEKASIGSHTQWVGSGYGGHCG